MAKPIAGTNQYPFSVNGINVEAAALYDGRKLTNIRIYKERSDVMFDLIDPSNLEIQRRLLLTGLDKNNNLLNVSDTTDALADKLEPGKFCISVVNDNNEVVGFAVKLMSHKIILQDGKVLYIENYDNQRYKDTGRIPVTGVSLSEQNVDVTKGEYYQLVAHVSPPDATIKNVMWKTSNPSVATVDNTGNVYGVGAGPATITVTTFDGEYTDSASINVKEKIINVQSVEFVNKSISLRVGEYQQLVYNITPPNATDKSVSFVSSDPLVASVDSTGQVIALKNGNASITITTTDGSKQDNCDITTTTSVSGINVSPKSININVGSSELINATVLPQSASNKEIVWDSSAPAIATVLNGTVTAVANGNAIITATTVDGSFSDSSDISVTTSVESIKLNKQSSTITVNQTEQLTYEMLPTNASNKAVTWSSNNDTVATVDQSGLVSGIAVGNAAITITTTDGNKLDTCNFVVEKEKVPVQSISLSSTSEVIYLNGTKQLAATILPVDADNKNVTWESSAPSICTVSSTGLVTSVALGNATITATSVDGNYKAECVFESVTYVKVGSVILDKISPLSLKVGDTTTITATVLPANATNKTVIWGNPYKEWLSSTVNGNTITITAIKQKTTTGSIILTAGAGSASTGDAKAVAILINITA